MVSRWVLTVFSLCVIFLSQFGLLVIGASAQADLTFLTSEENDFLHESVRIGANNAKISTGDGGWIHCFFGLDTVVWREGQMKSLSWGKELKSSTIESKAISGISRNSYAFLFRGELQVLGGRDFLHWHNHWLTFGPASNWYVRDLNGDVPEVIDGRRVARTGTETLLLFDDLQQVRQLNIEQGEFTLVGEIQPELQNYLGSFQVIELWDYVAFFGDLGGGIMKKATQEFVMNHELKLASLVGAEGWSMVANSLHLYFNQNPAPVIINADAIFNESSPAVLVVPAPVKSSESLVSRDLSSWGWVIGLVGGWSVAWFFFRQGRKEPSVETSSSSEFSRLHKSSPSTASSHVVLSSLGKERQAPKVVEAEVALSSDGVGSRPEVSEVTSLKSAQTSTKPTEAVKDAETSRGGSVQEIIASLVEGGDRQYSAAALNDQFGIAALSSDESQRARRARLVRQINDIYKRKHGHSLILRERDPKDRRHLIYRIKP